MRRKKGYLLVPPANIAAKFMQKYQGLTTAMFLKIELVALRLKKRHVVFPISDSGFMTQTRSAGRYFGVKWPNEQPSAITAKTLSQFFEAQDLIHQPRHPELS